MEILSRLVQHIEVGASASCSNLTMFPMFGPTRAESGYLTLDEALASGKARVTEVSAGGSVPELSFVNDADSAVLLMDGEGEDIRLEGDRVIGGALAARERVVHLSAFRRADDQRPTTTGHSANIHRASERLQSRMSL